MTVLVPYGIAADGGSAAENDAGDSEASGDATSGGARGSANSTDERGEPDAHARGDTA